MWKVHHPYKWTWHHNMCTYWHKPEAHVYTHTVKTLPLAKICPEYREDWMLKPADRQTKQTKTRKAYESLSRTSLTLVKMASLSFSIMINSIRQKTNRQNAVDKSPCTSARADLWCQKWSLSLRKAEGTQGCRGCNRAARSDGERCSWREIMAKLLMPYYILRLSVYEK